MPVIPSIGDGSQVKMRLAHEERPLPPDRKKIIALFTEVLELGLVQKVLVEVGKPLKFTRFVPQDEYPLQSEPPPVEAPSDALFDRIMSAPILEINLEEGQTLFHVIMKYFHLLTEAKLKPALFTVESVEALAKILEAPLPLNNLFGVPVQQESQVPRNLLLLSGTPEDSEEITISYKIHLTHPDYGRRKK